MFRIVILALCVIGTYGFAPRQQLPGRIVGGEEADIKDVPYLASLRLKGHTHHCSAIIISPKFILTAGSCVDYDGEFQVSVGSTLLNDKNVPLYDVKNITQHEKYWPGENDIALLELEKSLEFNEKVQALKLANEKPADRSSVIVSGWGRTSTNGPVSNIARKVSVAIVNRRVCRMLYITKIEITEKVLCAGDLDNGGKDFCKGDAGGPLVANGTVYGIVSFAYNCGEPEWPGVYTNIAHYREWIRKHSGL